MKAAGRGNDRHSLPPRKRCQRIVCPASVTGPGAWPPCAQPWSAHRTGALAVAEGPVAVVVVVRLAFRPGVAAGPVAGASCPAADEQLAFRPGVAAGPVAAAASSVAVVAA